ncbi:hypothetical protein [Halostagnicola kamekurae]|uniref:Uncharacterized protein n=1 Tax=Halostagnicola kamekurae TaxID=619731 RepID=A0A1I6UXE2_9EURY|nr:hypothetical protein [Halostagnicola kamekurae]SFT06073.1 hypothetical protein SAMN04488556_4148 [Halostagnicola kamekurae]
MEESNGLQILQTIYEEDIYWEYEQDYDKDHPVVEATEMDPETVQEGLAFLSQAGLIGRTKIGMEADVPRTGHEGLVGVTKDGRHRGVGMGITPNGFEVMHQRKIDSTQHHTNFALVVLTAGLLAASMIQAAVALLPQEKATTSYIIILVIAIGIILALYRLEVV